MTTDYRKVSPFNSPMESGVRSLVLLLACFPNPIDLQRLVVMDYLVVHSGDADGPKSLHAPLPLRVGELIVRRQLIEKGLQLMAGRGFISFNTDDSGITYESTEAAAPFIGALSESYNLNLISRARWVANRLSSMTNEQLSEYIRQISTDLEHQFQAMNLPVDVI